MVATIDADSAFIGAITAQGATCQNARAIASKELTLVDCENQRRTSFIRFEFAA